MNDPVIQYIIVRNDLASMTPGRAAAQAAHAANQCVFQLGHDGRFDLDSWERQGYGFGTTIVLQANWSQINLIKQALLYNNQADSPSDYIHFNVVTDPEYHVQDGGVIHLLPVDTCMWIFGEKESIAPYVQHLELW